MARRQLRSPSGRAAVLKNLLRRFRRGEAGRTVISTSTATWLGLGAPGVPLVDGDSPEYQLQTLVPSLNGHESPETSTEEAAPGLNGEGATTPMIAGADRGHTRRLEPWERDLEQQ